MPRLGVLGAIALGVCAACSVPIAAGLDESQANRAVVSLEGNGVAAQKEPDPEAEGLWRVTVGRDDSSAAVAVLDRENLPPSSGPGVLEALGKGSLVPSRTAEHARWVAGMAGELEASLQAVEGIVSARVHLAVPEADALAPEGERKTPSASVLVRHRGPTPPLAATEIQRLVAGAVPGLDAEAVSVVGAPAPLLKRPVDRELARFGPVTVTRGSMNQLRLIVGIAAVLNLALLAVVVLLWSKMRRVRGRLAEIDNAEP
jgi:type III secretion protein J